MTGTRPQPGTVILVRHGETEWNRTGRVQGWAPVSLNDRGREQARTLGRHLASTYDVDRLVASDLRRTRETTALIRETGVEPSPTFSRAWRERGVGVLQGLGREEAVEGHPEYWVASGVASLRATPEGGESILDLRERVLEGWDRLLNGTTAVGETVAVVTHGGPIVVLLGHVRGLSFPGAMAAHSPDNCAVTELRVAEGGPDGVRIARENVTC